MRKIFLFTILSFSLTACNQPKASVNESGKETKDTVKQEKKTPDNSKTTSSAHTAEELASYFSKEKSGSKTLIQPRNVDSNTNGLYCYFQVKNERATMLRFHIQYWSEKYANVDSYTYTIDGKTFNYMANRNRNVSADPRFGSTVFYWLDDDVDRTDLNFLNALAKGKNVTVNLIDRGTNEVIETLTLSDEEKLDVYRTLEYYKVLNGALIPKRGMVNIRR